MEIKHLLLGVTAAGGVCAGGYLLSRGAGGAKGADADPPVSAGPSEKAKAEPAADLPLQPDSSPAPKGSIVGESRDNPYERNTLGAEFAEHLLDAKTNAQDSVWTKRLADLRKTQDQSKLFGLLRQNNKQITDIKFTCEQMYTTKRTEWQQSTVHHATGEEEKKVLFGDAWRYCSVGGADRPQPADWPPTSPK